MSSVFRPKRRVNGRVRVGRTYIGQFRLSGDPKPTRIALGVSDKQVAEAKLSRIVRDAEREREGLAPPKAHRDAAKRPMEDYIDEYLASRRGLGCNEKYVRELGRKLFRLMREGGWRTLRDITGHSFETWRARTRARESLSPKTLNEYYNAIFGLCDWLEHRVGPNPMRSVERANTAGVAKRERRAFAADELHRLIEVSGERGIVYLVAASTGIRRGELGQIQWRDVQIDDARPYIRVRPSIAKNDKLAYQPLAPSVADALRLCRPRDVAPTNLVFERLIPRMHRFRSDLTAAGIAYVDTKGEYADFHALRKTYGTFLMLLGLPEFVRMKLMRHSDVKLTQASYTDASMVPIWDAIAGLPIFNDTQIDTLKLVAKGQSESAAVPVKDQGPVLVTAGGQSVSPSESASVGESPEGADGARCRVRTCDFLRVKQALYH